MAIKAKKKTAEPRADLHLWMHAVDARMDEVVRLLVQHRQQGDSIMATLQEVKDVVTQVKADIVAEKQEVSTKLAGLAKDVQDLKDQLAAGTAVTAQDLTDLAASIGEIDAGVKDISEPILP